MIRPFTLLMSLAALAGAASARPAAPPAPPFVPVYETNFPDPFILPHDGRYLAYATNAERLQAHVQMAVSDDLVNWRPLRRGGRLHDAMPVLPAWAQEGWTWAPEVMRHDGRYLLYFTARERRSGLQCTGVAHASDPLGPFLSEAPEPLICQRELGGTIDATPFLDADGQLYLYYKADANAVGKPTEIFVQRMTPDGLALAGEAVALLRNDKDWEAHVIESPTMVRRDGRYILFYSANHFGWEPHQRLSPYAMGYAVCEGPMGPCAEAPENPILYSYNDERGCLSGPGHQAIFDSGGRQYIVFHAHGFRPGCRNAGRGRYMYIAPLDWEAGTPRIGPSLRPHRRAGERG
ncbi:MAG: glycoside hydrolase family 43 protein [Allosphingosinicella sp.]|uniref:glycoside hydrolase family 43 protein n=1 Tax=Allosphingosinicella sp. TaxID=2823234 RepID=UPI003933EB24